MITTKNMIMSEMEWWVYAMRKYHNKNQTRTTEEKTPTQASNECGQPYLIINPKTRNTTPDESQMDEVVWGPSQNKAPLIAD